MGPASGDGADPRVAAPLAAAARGAHGAAVPAHPVSAQSVLLLPPIFHESMPSTLSEVCLSSPSGYQSDFFFRFFPGSHVFASLEPFFSFLLFPNSAIVRG